MSRLRRRRRRSPLRLGPLVRASAGWLLLVMQTLTATGASLPTFAATPIDGAAFPCQGGRCGCNTAEQCWKSCCCHTPQERLAWAEKHGVKPPDYLVAAVQGKTSNRGCGHVRSCCAARAASSTEACSTSSCESTTSESTTAEPTSGPLPAEPRSNSSADADTSSSPVVWISLIAAQRCRGSVPTWLNVPISLPATPPIGCLERTLLVVPFVEVGLPSPPTVSFSPPVPPPRIV